MRLTLGNKFYNQVPHCGWWAFWASEHMFGLVLGLNVNVGTLGFHVSSASKDASPLKAPAMIDSYDQKIPPQIISLWCRS